MPRPMKCRRIDFIPSVLEFIPQGNIDLCNDTVTLSLEELETIRLIDIEGLDQEQSSLKMEISRGTLQRILNSARNKVADSLINGKKLVINGGNYSISECIYICNHCDYKYKNENYNLNNSIVICPKCNSQDYKCGNKKRFCLDKCNRFRGGNI